MPAYNDITGHRFSRLVALYPVRAKKRRLRWLCLCDCGKTTLILPSNLRGGYSRSCGCWNKERTSEVRSKHKMAGTLPYAVWSSMKDRCHNPNNKFYKSYGGRGIVVSPRWRESFQSFHLDMGHRPTKGHSLDRIDNDGNYEPGNCRWATTTEQASNKRNTIRYSFDGKALSLAGWSAETGIPYRTLRNRVLRNNWPIEKALTQPVRR